VKRLIHANFKKNQISLVEYDVDAKANTEKSLIEGLEGISFRENNLINNSKNFSYYRKSTDGAFDSTKIAEDLKKQGVTDIILAGLNEEACVYETALGALKKGFNIITSPSITFNTYNTEPLSSFYSITGNVFQKQNDIQTLLDNNLFVKEPSKR
jgi:isochorismate hydrolase